MNLLVKCLLAWGIFYVVSFGIPVALGLSKSQDLAIFFFQSPRIEDHIFAITMTVVVFTLAALVLGAIYGGRSVRWLVVKLVLLSCALYVPVVMGFWHVMTIT